jgi:hypothetical protein
MRSMHVLVLLDIFCFVKVDPRPVKCSYGEMQETIAFISALILIWNVLSIPGLFQFTGFFIGVGLSSWIVDEFLNNE